MGKAIGWAVFALLICVATGASVRVALVITIIATLIGSIKF